MHARKLAIAIASLTLAGSVALAQKADKKEMAPKPKEEAKVMKAPDPAPAPPPAMPTEPPKPGAEMEAIKGFSKTWKCTGTAKDPSGADVAYTSTWKGKADLNKLWYSIEYKQTMKKPKMVFTGKGYVGWSAADKAYVFNGMDDWGGYIQLTSSGWSADGKALVFSGTAGGPMGKSGFRITFAKGASEKEGTVTMEAQMGKDWMAVQTETCKM